MCTAVFKPNLIFLHSMPDFAISSYQDNIDKLFFLFQILFFIFMLYSLHKKSKPVSLY